MPKPSLTDPLFATVVTASPLAVRFKGDTNSTSVGLRAGDFTPSVDDVVVVLRVEGRLIVVCDAVDA